MNTPGSFTLGRYFGIPVRAHWSIAFLAILLFASFSTGPGILAGLAITVALFASILLHEFGHALVARRFGMKTESVDFMLFGGATRLDRPAPTPRAEGLTAAAGPAVNVVLGAIAIGIAIPIQSSVLVTIAIMNFFLAVFNMLPGLPLDGGRVLRAVRWSQTGNRYRAMRDAGNAGRVLGWGMVAGGLVMMLNGLPGIFVAVTGLFIALNAKAEIMASYMGEQLDGVKVRDLTWFGIAHAGSDMDADSMIWQRSRLGDAGAVAIDATGDGQLDGLVLEEQLWAVPSERRAMVMLTQLMTPFSTLAKASPDEDLSAVLPRLNPLKPVLTVWNGETLLGIVPPKRLTERLNAAQQQAFSN